VRVRGTIICFQRAGVRAICFLRAFPTFPPRERAVNRPTRQSSTIRVCDNSSNDITFSTTAGRARVRPTAPDRATTSRSEPRPRDSRRETVCTVRTVERSFSQTNVRENGVRSSTGPFPTGVTFRVCSDHAKRSHTRSDHSGDVVSTVQRNILHRRRVKTILYVPTGTESRLYCFDGIETESLVYGGLFDTNISVYNITGQLILIASYLERKEKRTKVT